MSTSIPQSSHAYGIGLIALVVAMSAIIVFYQSYYLPESLAKPSVSHDILEADTLHITIISGATEDDGNDYEPKRAVAVLGVNNKVVWTNNDSTAHTVTPGHRYVDGYSGEFKSPGVIMPGESYEFLFTEETEQSYQCEPHPWMRATILVEQNRY